MYFPDESGQRACGHLCQSYSCCRLGDSQEPQGWKERPQSRTFWFITYALVSSLDGSQILFVGSLYTLFSSLDGSRILFVGSLCALLFVDGSQILCSLRCTTTSPETPCPWNGVRSTTQRRPTWWSTLLRGWFGSLGEASSKASSSIGKLFYRS